MVLIKKCNNTKDLKEGNFMKKILFLVGSALFLLTGCSDEKKEEVKVEVKKEVQQKVEEPKKDIKAEVKKEEPKVVQKAPEVKKIEAVKPVQSEPKKVAAKTGKELFMKCASCHGMKAEKKALGKSKIVKDMSEQEIVDSLMGYKNGTYGGAMKGIMKGQVLSLSDQDIKTLAKYIKTLK